VEDDEATMERDEFERRFRAFLGEALATGRWTVFVVEEAGQLVATTYVQEIERVPRPRHRVEPWGYVTGVYTRREHRDAGIGSRLMAHVIAWARARPLHGLVLWPSERSVPFYRRAGLNVSPDAHEIWFTED
jgi:GNAT superfamily N-acetyltransferase